MSRAWVKNEKILDGAEVQQFSGGVFELFNEVPVGFIIGAALSVKSGRITKSDLRKIRESVLENAPGYYVDFSRDSIYSEIEANCDCFLIEDDKIFLSEFYMERPARVRRYYYEMLDEEVRLEVDMALA